MTSSKCFWVFGMFVVLAGCPEDGDFRIDLDEGAGSVEAAASLTVAVRVTPVASFTGEVRLAVDDLPVSVTAQFAPESIVGSGTSTLTLTTAAGAAASTQPLVIRGTSGGVTHETPFQLTVKAAGNGAAFSVDVDPGQAFLVPGDDATSTVTVTPRNGFTGNVNLSAAGLPDGVVATFAPVVATVAGEPVSVMLRLRADVTAALTTGPVAALVAANAGGATQVVPLSISIIDASDPDARRVATLAAVEDEARRVAAQQQSTIDQLTAIAAFMASRSDYVATDVDAETLSATGVFRDGRLHVISLNYMPPPPAHAGVRTALAAGAGAEIPRSPHARLFHAFGTSFPTQSSIDNAKLYLHGRGWQIRPGQEGDARVSKLREMSGDGFFYINTHAGRISAGVDLLREPDGKLYSLGSSTPAHTPLEKNPEFADDLAAHRLVYFTAPTGNTIIHNGNPVTEVDTRYGITRYFVEKYWRFADNAVVMVNACFSSRNDEFIFTILQKGAGVYLGWSDTITPAVVNSSLEYFTDRSVGANTYQPEHPFQRPFSYDLVLADMAAKGLDTDPSSGAKLRARARQVAPPALAPSIRTLVVSEFDGEIKLLGGFGSVQGKVTVGEAPVAIKSWSPDTIVCDLPLTGAGSSGDVQVEIDGVRSNRRQLTEWKMSLHYKWTDALGAPHLLFDGTATLRWRADVGAVRDKPGVAPADVVRTMTTTRESSLPLTGSGSTGGDCPATLSGTGTFKSPNQQPRPPLVMVGLLKPDTSALTGALGLEFGAMEPPFWLEGSAMCGGRSRVAAVFGLLEGQESFAHTQEEGSQEFLFPALKLQFTSAFVLKRRDYRAPELPGALHVTWSDVMPASPPRDDIESGK
jgi:hypothetical protein